jgi:hypothetical protein
MWTIYEGSQRDGALTQWVSVECLGNEIMIFTAIDSEADVGTLDMVRLPLALARKVAAALAEVR